MNKIEKRLAALETFAGRPDDSGVLAFMIDGASDDDVIVIKCMGLSVDRQPGETLAELVGRMKALSPVAAHHVMFFEYHEALLRPGTGHMSEALPNTWPVPSPSGHACHVEARP